MNSLHGFFQNVSVSCWGNKSFWLNWSRFFPFSLTVYGLKGRIQLKSCKNWRAHVWTKVTCTSFHFFRTTHACDCCNRSKGLSLGFSSWVKEVCGVCLGSQKHVVGSGSWAKEGNNNSHFSFSSPWCLEDFGEFNKIYIKPNSENKATHPPASTKQGLRENNNKRLPSFATNVTNHQQWHWEQRGQRLWEGERAKVEIK